jgi:diadenylate cyclase
LANKQFGALIAIERDTSIRVYEETGVIIDSHFSVELLLTIFHPKAALHDGGVIMRNGRIAAAACIFPVSQRETLDRSLGLRHRAGLGITEESDAVAVVVSEETGTISLANAGRINTTTVVVGKKVVVSASASDGLSIDAHAIVQAGAECAP